MSTPFLLTATRRQIRDLRARTGLKRIHKLLPWAVIHSGQKLPKGRKIVCRRVPLSPDERNRLVYGEWQKDLAKAA